MYYLKELYCKVYDKMTYCEDWECIFAAAFLLISAAFSITLIFWGISKVFNALKLEILWQQLFKKIK